MQKLGVFWKIQDICHNMGTEIFKIKEEMTEKMKLKVAKLRVVMAIFPRKDTFLDTLYT